MGKLIGTLLLIVGLFFAYRSFWLRINGISAFGIVTSVNIGKGRTLIISFKAHNKKTFTFSSGIRFLPLFTFYNVGDTIPILYDSLNPTYVMIDNFDVMWLSPAILLISGIIILSVSMF